MNMLKGNESALKDLTTNLQNCLVSDFFFFNGKTNKTVNFGKPIFYVNENSFPNTTVMMKIPSLWLWRYFCY